MRRRPSTYFLAFVALVPLGFGCGMNQAQKGASIGGADAAIGRATGSTVRGTITDAAVGGVAGAAIGHQMDRHASELAYDLPGATIQRIGEGIAVTFPDGQLFRFGSDHLMMTAEDNLRRFAASLNKYSNTRTFIIGHTDSQGGGRYNMDLSNRLAESAASFIWEAGVDRDRIIAMGRGETEPIYTNGSDYGRAQNRRVEVAIYVDGR